MKRRVLVLSPFPPRRDGLHGGCRATASVVAELAGACEVRLLYLRADNEPPPETALAGMCHDVEEVRRPGATLGAGRAVLMASALRHGLPFWIGNWRVQAFRRRFQEIVREWKPDIIHVECQTMAQYLRPLPAPCPTVLVIHEPGTSVMRERMRSAPFWAKWLFRREVACWQEFESSVLPTFDAVVCLSDRDRRDIEAVTHASGQPRIHVIPLRVSGKGAALNPPPVGPPTVFFAGNFVHPPNRAAAMRLARDIFPQVLLRCPQAALCIAGADPPAALQAYASASVQITGRVPDMQPLLAASTVVALPLDSGGGMRVKTLEALAAGKPVVGSRLAVEGLQLQDGVHFRLAESNTEFTNSIVELLSNASDRRRLSASALQWAAAWCKPGLLARAYESLYAPLIDGQSPTR